MLAGAATVGTAGAGSVWFWARRLPRSRKGTRWDQILFVLVTYRLLSPGSEWRLHRQWFDQSALADLLSNTADNTTLRDFLDRIERQYGKARSFWVMDRGIPTEETLEQMRSADPPVHYLVGTPKGRLTRLEKDLLLKPWEKVRPGVQVKLLPQDDELYVFAQSTDRVAKERAMRKRQLHPHAPGLTPRSVLEKFASVQMIDVEIPTIDGRTIQLTRYTEPPRELKLLLERLHLKLLAQPPLKIAATQAPTPTSM